VHTQARWPRIYENLIDVIGFLKEANPLWFILEYEIEPGVWERINTSEESRRARYADFYEERMHH
jgi:hypothetical protein